MEESASDFLVKTRNGNTFIRHVKDVNSIRNKKIIKIIKYYFLPIRSRNSIVISSKRLKKQVV